MRDVRRWRSRRRAPALVATAVFFTGCAAPAPLKAIQRAHPGASYEAETAGCGARVPAGRRFGGDLRAAVLWGRVVTDTARVVPCEVVIAAVREDSRVPVYLVARRMSHREERVLTP